MVTSADSAADVPHPATGDVSLRRVGGSVVLDGRAIAVPVRQRTAAQVAVLAQHGILPGLAVVRVGDDPASAVYVGAKLKAAAALGIHAREHHLAAGASQAELLGCISGLAGDDTVDGVLVQLPLPKQLDVDAALALVPPDKDVDGFGLEAAGALSLGLTGLRPCTPAGVMAILQAYAAQTGFRLRGKRALVIGRSRIVGRPTATMLVDADATVTIAHSRSADLAGLVAAADVVIAAAGVPHLVRADWLRPTAVVIDVGIHRLSDGSLTGDVEPEAMGRVAAMTPVPGGVGPMTIAMLMANCVEAAIARRGRGRQLEAELAAAAADTYKETR